MLRAFLYLPRLNLEGLQKAFKVLQMQLRLENIEPHPLLKSYIEKMWLLESSGKMPVDDLKLFVPNRHIKLSVAFRNGIVADVGGKSFTSKEQNIF